MDCEIHNFDPQLAWVRAVGNDCELKVKCTKCGKFFTFYEPIQDVIAFLHMRKVQREFQRRTGFGVRFG